jgi:integrase
MLDPVSRVIANAPVDHEPLTVEDAQALDEAREWLKHNAQTITLPPELTKNSREHILPLGPMALALLAQAAPEGGYYFPSGRKKDAAFSGFSKPKKQLDKLLPGLKPWTLHDLRRTFSTNIARLGIPPHIKEALLNHVSAKSEVEAVYDLYTYLPEMRAAMLRYEDFISSLLKRE